MTQTIYGGKAGSELLLAGHVLTVTLDAGAGARLQRLYGGTVVESAALSASTTYGPYLHDMEFRVSALAGATVTIDTAAQTAQGLNAAKTAAADSLVSRDGNRGRGPTMGTRIPAGPLLVVTTGANAAFFDATHQATIRLARGAFAVRLVFAGYAASATTGITAAVSAGTDVAGNGSAGTWIAATFGGSSSGTIPARQSATRPTLYLSDWIGVDVASKILCARVYVPASGNTEFTVADFTQQSSPAGTSPGAAAWATTTGDEWANRRQGVDGVSTPANFTSTATQNFSGIYGVQYLTHDGVVTIGGSGDSIMSGTYSTLAYDPHWVRAARALKLAGYGIETANLAWTGQTSAIYYLRALDALTTLGLQHLIYSPWSPNDGGNDPTWVHFDGMRSRWEAVIAAAIAARCNVIPITGIPKTTGGATTSAWTDAEDDIRRNLNAEVRDYPTYLDPDIIVGNRPSVGQTASGWTDASYVETSGYIHPTEAGNEACKTAMQAILATLVPS